MSEDTNPPIDWKILRNSSFLGDGICSLQVRKKALISQGEKSGKFEREKRHDEHSTDNEKHAGQFERRRQRQTETDREKKFCQN
jgi:hypothetical protein